MDCSGSIERSSIAESLAASTADAALSSFSVRQVSIEQRGGEGGSEGDRYRRGKSSAREWACLCDAFSTVHTRIRSALEIYNEEVRDLSVDEMPKLDVREAPDAVSFFCYQDSVTTFLSSDAATHVD